MQHLDIIVNFIFTFIPNKPSTGKILLLPTEESHLHILWSQTENPVREIHCCEKYLHYFVQLSHDSDIKQI